MRLPALARPSLLQASFVDYGHTQALGLGQLRAGRLAEQQVAGLFADAVGDFAAAFFDECLGLVTRPIGQRAGDHEGVVGQRPRRRPGRPRLDRWARRPRSRSLVSTAWLPGRANQSTTAWATFGPTPSTACRASSEAARERIQRPKCRGQVASHHLAYAADAQRRQQQRQRAPLGGMRWRPAGSPPSSRQNLGSAINGSAVRAKISATSCTRPAATTWARHLFAETDDVHDGRKVFHGARELGRAGAVDAVVGHFAFQPLDRPRRSLGRCRAACRRFPPRCGHRRSGPITYGMTSPARFKQHAVADREYLYRQCSRSCAAWPAGPSRRQRPPAPEWRRASCTPVRPTLTPISCSVVVTSRAGNL